MNKKYLLASIYVLLLLGVGFFIINYTSRSKLDSQIETFRNKDVPLEQRLAVLWRLAGHADEKVTKVLIRGLQDPNPYIRIEASKLVGRRKEYRAIPHLIRNLSDNTKIFHKPTATALPMVKIVSYNALKRITGKDLGPVESPDPVEVAETVRKWEMWWRANARKLGLEVSEIVPDYETLVIDSTIPKQQRIEYLSKALREGYPGLADIVLTLLKKEKTDSFLVFSSLCIAAQYKMTEAVSVIIGLLEKEMNSSGGSLTAARLNEFLVQITGEHYGPLYNGMDAGKREKVLEKWKSLKLR